jgi:hypothetical protein
MLKRLTLLTSLFLLCVAMWAQSSPSAERPHFALWAGAEISTFNPDFGCANSSPFSCGSHQLIGVSPFLDANHVIFRRLFVEGESRFLRWNGPGGGLTETSYLTGPSLHLMHFRRTVLFSCKFLFGGGRIHVPDYGPGNGTYFVYAPGGVFDIKMTKRMAARAEYEYQKWPSFKGIATATTTGTGGLTPNGFSFGVSYALLQ